MQGACAWGHLRRFATASGILAARKAGPSLTRFFERIRTIADYLAFPDWKTLITTLIQFRPLPKSKNRFGPDDVKGSKLSVAGGDCMSGSAPYQVRA